MNTGSDLPPIFCRRCGYCLYGLPEPRCPECGTGFDPADPKTYRHRLPRSWKSIGRVAALLLLAALAYGGMCAWLYWGWAREQPAVGRLRAVGFDVATRPMGPMWLAALVPEKLRFVLDRATTVGPATDAYGRTILPSAATDADLADIAALGGLEALDLRCTGITDASLPALGQLRKLKSLALSGTKLTGRGLAAIAPLEQLEKLDLGGIYIGEDGASNLRSLRRLRSLNLAETGVGDGGVRVAAELPALEELTLADTVITPAGLMQLASAPSLRSLDVYEVIEGTGTLEAASTELGTRCAGLTVRYSKDLGCYLLPTD